MITDIRKGNFAARERQIRVKTIIATLREAKEQDKSVDLKKFMAQMALNQGISTRKLQEYIEQLLDAGVVNIDSQENIIELGVQ